MTRVAQAGMPKAAGLPAMAGLPPFARMPAAGGLPRMMAVALPAPATRPASVAGHRAPAVLPHLAPGTRSELRTLHVHIWVDESGSTAWTDPDMARRHDVGEVFIPWMAEEMPVDLVTIGSFDDAAAVTMNGPVADIAEAGCVGAFTRIGFGGTLFVPAVMESIAIARTEESIVHVFVMVTDGWGPDVEQADALLGANGITGVVVPFGPEFPFISAGWERAHNFAIAAHVQQVPNGIASTVARVATKATGALVIPKPPRKRVRGPSKSTQPRGERARIRGRAGHRNAEQGRG